MKQDSTKNWQVFPGFELELMATGFDLPVNIAFVKNPKKAPNAPLAYVTELYGQVKVITNNWLVHTFAKNLLNFEPTKPFLPGMGESGVTGICIDPLSGDLFLAMIYLDEKQMKNKVVQIFHILKIMILAKIPFFGMCFKFVLTVIVFRNYRNFELLNINDLLSPIL